MPDAEFVTEHSKTVEHVSTTGKTPNDHHNQAHVLSGADHTAAGLVAGQVPRASAATAFAWATLAHGDLGTVTADQHHAQAHHAAHEPGGADPMATDAAAATASLRTLGTGATQAAAGNDSRLSDSRAPTGTASGDLTGTYPSPTIADGAVSYAKIQDTASGSVLIGRGAGAAGDVQELTVGGGLSFAGTVLSSAGASGGTPALTLSTSNAAGSSSTFIRDDDQLALFDTTSPVTQAFGDTAAVGTASVAARRDHKHGMPSERAASSTTPAAVGTAAVGTGTTDARSDHVHATGAGTPTTSALADAAATGTGPAAAMTDHRHGRESFATNAIVLGTAAAAGAATTPFRSDDTIAAFDATVPVTQAFADTAATGSAAKAARRDHVHGMPTSTTGPDADVTVDTAGAAGTANTASRSGHGHRVLTASSTPLAQGVGSAGTSGTAPSRGDHVHPSGTTSVTTRLTLDGSQRCSVRGPGDRQAGTVVVGANSVGTPIVGTPRTPMTSFTVPAGYFLGVLGPMTLGPNIQATLETNAQVEIQNRSTTSRINLVGRG